MICGSWKRTQNTCLFWKDESEYVFLYVYIPDKLSSSWAKHQPESRKLPCEAMHRNPPSRINQKKQQLISRQKPAEKLFSFNLFAYNKTEYIFICISYVFFVAMASSNETIRTAQLLMKWSCRTPFMCFVMATSHNFISHLTTLPPYTSSIYVVVNEVGSCWPFWLRITKQLLLNRT